MIRQACLLLLTAMLLFAEANMAHALHPELAIPERVDANHKACRELIHLAEKYNAGKVFPKDFEKGTTSCPRMDVALAVQMIAEKMADTVVKEGAAAVAKEDLEMLEELRYELRGEMLLVNTRAFQQRREELGTRLHALTRNITLSGGLTGVIQGSLNNEPRNQTDAVGRGDLVFNFKVGEGTIAVIDVDATGGDGLDAVIASFSLLNGVAGSTEDRVRFREAWIEHIAFSDRLLLTIGKIDLTNYFDTNEVANDENSQFLSGAFVNSAIIGAPPVGPGVRLQAELAEPLVFGIGYGSGTGEAAGVGDHGFGVAELDYKVKVGEREGNYRVYGTIDATIPEGNKVGEGNTVGIGFSIDQQLTDQVTLFGRYGWRDDMAYDAYSAWSLGFQLAGFSRTRKDDTAGIAYGQVLANGVTAQEKLAEVYYQAKLNEQIAVSPHFQYLINPLGDKNAKDVLLAGLRTQISF